MILKVLILILIQLIFHCTADNSVRVHTLYGDVLGYQTDLARIFYGIPYAEPPIGSKRWQPPTPVVNWEPKTINATQIPSACIQGPANIAIMDNPSVISENCLFLNIFTPILNNASSTDLPVMIFIHGGGFQFGYASDPSIEPEHLVNTTNVIVVLIQYRLGALGFLATGSGSNDLNGNYGILDQRLAIRWIKENIDAFGGNSDQITLFGQSAGGQSTTLHYLSNEMQSYFQRAIIQSSPMTVPFRTYDEYITASVLFADQLNCTINEISCFRLRSSADILNAQNKVNIMLTSLNPLFYFEPWLPVIDGLVISGSLLEMLNNVSFPLKPLIIGTVSEECYDFVYGSTWGKAITTSDYVAFILALFPEKAFQVIEHFPPDSSNDQRALVTRICTEWVFACSTRTFSKKAATYSYVFGYPYDRSSFSSSFHCAEHACHADELPFIFEVDWSNLTDAGRLVSRSIATYWTNFATTENPNQPNSVSLNWPRTDENQQVYVSIENPLSVNFDYLKVDCDFWDKIGYKIPRN